MKQHLTDPTREHGGKEEGYPGLVGTSSCLLSIESQVCVLLSASHIVQWALQDVLVGPRGPV